MFFFILAILSNGIKLLYRQIRHLAERNTRCNSCAPYNFESIFTAWSGDLFRVTFFFLFRHNGKLKRILLIEYLLHYLYLTLTTSRPRLKLISLCYFQQVAALIIVEWPTSGQIFDRRITLFQGYISLPVNKTKIFANIA